jgi:hypothetical protein
MKYVFVNGIPAFDDGNFPDKLTGKALRHSMEE